MKMMPPDVISHENQLKHLSQPSIFILDAFRTADHAGQIFIPHRPRLWNYLPPEPHHFFTSTTVIANHKTSPSYVSSISSPRTFHSKLKCHFFKHFYPDPSDHSPSPSERHPP